MVLRSSILACLAALALAACGGSNDSDKPLDRKDLVARANDVCRTYTAKAKALKQPAGGDTSGGARFFAQAATIAADQHTALGKLDPAADVRSDWRAFYARDAEGSAALKRLADAARGRASNEGASILEQLSSLDERLDAAARTLGATACGSGA